MLVTTRGIRPTGHSPSPGHPNLRVTQVFRFVLKPQIVLLHCFLLELGGNKWKEVME